MKNREINILWLPLLIWILATGSPPLECMGPEDRACQRPLVSGPADITWDWEKPYSESEWIAAHHWDHKEITCRDILCRPMDSLITRHFNPPKTGMDQPRVLPRFFMDRNHRANPFFTCHGQRRSVPIYTILQSYLC